MTLPDPPLWPRFGARESNSSKNTTQGADSRALKNTEQKCTLINCDRITIYVFFYLLEYFFHFVRHTCSIIPVLLLIENCICILSQQLWPTEFYQFQEDHKVIILNKIANEKKI